MDLSGSTVGVDTDSEVDVGTVGGGARILEGEGLGGRAKRYLFRRGSQSRETSQQPDFDRPGMVKVHEPLRCVGRVPRGQKSFYVPTTS